MSTYDSQAGVERLLSQQEALRQVIEEISSELELQPLLTSIVRRACELLQASDGSIGLYDRERGVIRTQAAYRMPPGELGSEMGPGEGLAGQVLLTRKPVVLERYGEVQNALLPELAENAVLGVPIFWGQTLVGFFGIGAKPPRRFDQRDVDILSLFARHVAIAIENAKLFDQARRLAVLEERQRLARDLHDSVTQMLFSATLIAQAVPQAYRRDPQEGERRLARLLELNRAALGEMRALLRELRPSEEGVEINTGEFPLPTVFRVRRDGLLPVLDEILQEVERDGLETRREGSGYHRQSPDLEETLFRVIQEGLHNVSKHARARCVEVVLRCRQGCVHLRVADDGIGFDARQVLRRPAPESGIGVVSMRERVRALGGTFRLESAPGLGTRIEVTLPETKAPTEVTPSHE